MNHEIEDDVHVRAPFEERVEAMGLDKQWLLDDFCQGDYGGIEPFYKAYLQDRMIPPGGVDQFISFREGDGDWLFHKRGYAGF